MRSLARVVRNVDRAEELAQDALVIALSEWPRTGVPANPAAWLLLAGSFLFTGALYVANAAFNNLGFPLLSTMFNWGRATLGTIPFAAWGASYGPRGVLIGQAAGSLLFGIGAIVVAFRAIDGLERRGVSEPNRQMPVPNAPSACSALITLTAHTDDDAAHARCKG